MFRYINISVFALVIAGVANAGGIDPAVTGNYSSSDGTLFTSAIGPSSTWINAGGFGGLSGTLVQPNSSNFQLSKITVNAGGSSAADTTNGLNTCPYANAFQSGGSVTCDSPVLSSDLLFQPILSGSTFTLDFAVNSNTTIYGFNLFLAENAGGTVRGISGVSFSNGSFTTSEVVNPDYTAYLGSSNKLKITDLFSSGLAITAGTDITFVFTMPGQGSENTPLLGPRIWSVQSIDSPVPEPGTWMLAGLGMLGLIAATKMRNRRLQSKL